MNKSSITLREKAKAWVSAMSDEVLDSMLVRGHLTNSHKWVECYPDGSIHEAEDADNNTTHWIDYPHKAVASIYNIAYQCAEACNCDICNMYGHFRYYDKKNFITYYSKEDWDYCNEHNQIDAILAFERDNGSDSETIRQKMLDAIDNIDFGYFLDECA